MKQINIFIILVCAIVATWFIYSYATSDDVDFSQRSQIDEIRRMVKLNSLQMQEEVIYCDTLDYTGVVVNSQVNIVVGFDVEHLQWFASGDTMFVVMPPATVEKYQLGKERCVDVYDIRDPGFFDKRVFVRPTINSAQSTELHKRIEKHVDRIIERENLVERAKILAMSNLAKLLSAFKEKIVIIDHLPENIDPQIKVYKD